MIRLFSILLVFICFSCTQEELFIDGSWTWSFDNDSGEHHEVELHLFRIDDNTVSGYYCSNYADGNRVDCSSDETVRNIHVKRVSAKDFEGEFTSSASNKTGKIEITKDPLQPKIQLNILEEPAGEFFLPDEVWFAAQ